MDDSNARPQAEDPLAVLELIECSAEPRHFELYYKPEPDDIYPPPCLYCAYDAIAAAHDPCEHSHHRAWRRWKITHKVALWLYSSGITSNGGGRRWGGGCEGCQTMPTLNRNRRVYVLGVRLDDWRCLLRMRHIPGDPIGLGMCSKCLPCPDCGSTTAGHKAGCPS